MSADFDPISNDEHLPEPRRGKAGLVRQIVLVGILVVIEPLRKVHGNCTTFCSCEILYGME